MATQTHLRASMNFSRINKARVGVALLLVSVVAVAFWLIDQDVYKPSLSRDQIVGRYELRGSSRVSDNLVLFRDGRYSRVVKIAGSDSVTSSSSKWTFTKRSDGDLYVELHNFIPPEYFGGNGFEFNVAGLPIDRVHGTVQIISDSDLGLYYEQLSQGE